MAKGVKIVFSSIYFFALRHPLSEHEPSFQQKSKHYQNQLQKRVFPKNKLNIKDVKIKVTMLLIK